MTEGCICATSPRRDPVCWPDEARDWDEAVARTAEDAVDADEEPEADAAISEALTPVRRAEEALDETAPAAAGTEAEPTACS